MELFLRGRSVIVLLAEEALELRLLLALLVELMEVLLDVVFELVQLSVAWLCIAPTLLFITGSRNG